MRSRRCSGSGRPLGDTEVSGRRVTCKAPLAHVEGGSGRPEALPTAILKDTHSVEGEFSELRLDGVLRMPPVGDLSITHLRSTCPSSGTMEAARSP
jgi:hypothetical protein